ncbi:hypothetical protein DMUE_3837 [Dictyocoela muelleri]|nr:hypothetical protein DMUE_3837 [Dictyocoela muelleri]
MDEEIFFMKLEKSREEIKKQKLKLIETFHNQRQNGYSKFYSQDRDLETINMFYGYISGLNLLNDEEIKIEFINKINNNEYDILKNIVFKRVPKDKILEKLKS